VISDPPLNSWRPTKLSKTWVLNTGNTGVSLDGVDVSSWFSQFSLTFNTDFTFTSSNNNSPNPWPTSGTWSFAKNADGSANLRQIVRGDGLVINIDTFSDTVLIFSFQFDDSTHSSGREEGVTGVYIFNLTN